MHRSSIELQNLIEPQKPSFCQARVTGSTGLNVLSLFDGMSCGQLALQRAGIKVNKYYASEIDKHAIKVTMANFPNTIQLGDVTKVFAKDLDKIDLVIGGSPCQGFSFAGKGLNFEDPRSMLFFEFVRLVNECNPKYFLLENVKMKKEHELVISQYMKVAPIEINSALLSAQNRVRLYWTNINQVPWGLFGDMITDIPQPKDKKILLKDILESDVPDKFYLSDKMLKYFETRSANFNGGKVNVRNEEGKATAILASSASCDISDNFIKVDTTLKVSNNQDKANCFTAGGNSGGLHSDMTLIVASRGRNPQNQKSRDVGLNTEQMLEPRFDGKTNCLTSVQKDNLVLSIPEATKKGYVEIEAGQCFDFENPNSETRRGRKMEVKSNCLMAKETDFMQFTNEGKIRRLTPTECERLQTVPDGYTNYVSDTQRYRMLGNGWTVDVIAYIFSYMQKLSNYAGC
jgi:DNA (cytosine-5)-methyltransferase 3A